MTKWMRDVLLRLFGEPKEEMSSAPTRADMLGAIWLKEQEQKRLAGTGAAARSIPPKREPQTVDR